MLPPENSPSAKAGPSPCERCKGQGWYLVITPTHPHGKLTRCDACVDLLQFSRLNAAERRHKLDHIADLASDGSHTVLRWRGRDLLADPYGWWVLWGDYGAAKSLLLTALVAEFCRQGTRAIYFHGKDLEQGLFRDQGDANNRELYRAVPVLAIDEIHTINVRNDWIAGELGALLEERYRNQAEQVTLVAMNPDPQQWTHNSAGAAWSEIGPAIWSRMNDGRFRRAWDAPTSAPACLGKDAEVPGVFRVTGPDVRPTLRRIVQDPPAIRHHGQTKTPAGVSRGNGSSAL